MPEVGAATRPWKQCLIAVLLLLARNPGPHNFLRAPRLHRDLIPNSNLLEGCRPEPGGSVAILMRRRKRDFVATYELQSCRGNNRAPRKDCRAAMPPRARKSTPATFAPELGVSGVAFPSAYPLTVVGVCFGVKGMPVAVCFGGGEGDQCQGCAGPRGRTLSEVQTR
jgi:hypothetical protein